MLCLVVVMSGYNSTVTHAQLMDDSKVFNIGSLLIIGDNDMSSNKITDSL